MDQPSSSADSAAARPEYTRWFLQEVEPHESGLRAWLRKRFPALVDVDDVVQEAYLRLFRAKDAGRIRQPKTYLYSTARNAALDFFRHKRVVAIERMPETMELPVADGRPDAAEATAQDEELALLAEAISELPERCREVLVLRKLHGLSQKEIAEKLGISENTVAAQASTGVRRCMEYFRERNLKR